MWVSFRSKFNSNPSLIHLPLITTITTILEILMKPTILISHQEIHVYTCIFKYFLQILWVNILTFGNLKCLNRTVTIYAYFNQIFLTVCRSYHRSAWRDSETVVSQGGLYPPGTRLVLWGSTPTWNWWSYTISMSCQFLSYKIISDILILMKVQIFWNSLCYTCTYYLKFKLPIIEFFYINNK